MIGCTVAPEMIASPATMATIFYEAIKGIDLLFGGDGDDTLIGDTDFDELRGNAGSDNFFDDSIDSLVDFNPNEDKKLT